MKKLSFFFIALFVFVLLLPANVLACACCADSGDYSIQTSKPGSAELEILNNIKFDKVSELFMGGEIKGMQGKGEYPDRIINYSEFKVINTFAAKTWKFNFNPYDDDELTGTLTLPMPLQMLNFKVDIHDGKMGGGGGPLLYKEWRFKGTVQSGKGFFQAGIIKPTTYFLVLQGRGNNCDNAEDFTNWILEVNGKQANYRFFGKLSSGTS